ncbi:MAG: hypothetical protein JRG86_04170 [Deltaproteobacteria bacterium]|jgi:hypothetical protein|nr:hypothetical protein [Deltaproteobacteria bacterium]MBW2497445.1 hypothetical protein [Deltaproteobacteria bacterium]
MSQYDTPTRFLAFAVFLAVLVFSQSAAAGNGGKSKDSDPTAALSAMAAGDSTIAGPGLFTIDNDGRGNVYRVISGAPFDVCITVRNLARTGRVAITAPGEGSVNVRPNATRALCYAAPSEIRLKCEDTRSCNAVWRVDRL